MGYFKQLDLKIRNWYGDAADILLPLCADCGGSTQIINFVPPNNFTLLCQGCARKINYVAPKSRTNGRTGRSAQSR